jgi:transcriptional regulator with XRE-family HTH domain
MVTALKVERIRKGIKQWRLASLLGISQAELSHYETGRRTCPKELQDKIAKVLECSGETLFPASEEKTGA